MKNNGKTAINHWKSIVIAAAGFFIVMRFKKINMAFITAGGGLRGYILSLVWHIKYICLMVKKAITGFMACLLLAGSMLLPLNDFSLIKDIPAMYSSYLKIAAPEEASITDFIGDYLLHGKEILRHNKQDKPENGTDPAQFLHQANPLGMTLPQHIYLFCTIQEPGKKRSLKIQPFQPAEYHSKLFRPPLA